MASWETPVRTAVSARLLVKDAVVGTFVIEAEAFLPTGTAASIRFMTRWPGRIGGEVVRQHLLDGNDAGFNLWAPHPVAGQCATCRRAYSPPVGDAWHTGQVSYDTA
jgi:hypothetical protein